jgi:hypothetical protein
MTLGSTQPLSESSWGVNGGRRVRLATLPPSVSRLSRENLGIPTSHNPMGLHGLLKGQLYLLHEWIIFNKNIARNNSGKHSSFECNFFEVVGIK